MLFAACASTSPTTASRNSAQSTEGPPWTRFASTARRPPMSPDQMVIGNTAARVMTSHLPTVSSGLVAGGLAVSRISFQASSRSRSGMVVAGAGAARSMGSSGRAKRASALYHVPARRPGAKMAEMADVPSIPTPRFELVSMSLPFMEALIDRDLERASRELGAAVPADMPDDLVHFLEYRTGQVRDDPSVQQWIGRAIVLDDVDGRRVIGSIGFHGPPDDDGRVEVGYPVEPGHRRRGVATEVVRALFDWANREHGITKFRAATSPDNLASQAVLARFGFRRTGVQMDDIDGPELVFELDGWAATS